MKSLEFPSPAWNASLYLKVYSKADDAPFLPGLHILRVAEDAFGSKKTFILPLPNRRPV